MTAKNLSLILRHKPWGRWAACLGIALAASLPSQSWAWGALGHQIVAALADQQLTPQTRQKIQRLLELEPGATMMSISTWADESRTPATSAWHYVNFPRGECNYDAARDCSDGKCVVAAIERQIEVLKTSTDDSQRLKALKYVVHFVGDVHQPLHAGYADDRGGNSYQLQAFMRGSNLHSVWDSGLIKNESENLNDWVRKLSTAPQSKVASVPVAVMAEESCRIVAQEGFYPGRLVDVPYINKYTPVASERLQMAGFRLAQLLNDALAGAGK